MLLQQKNPNLVDSTNLTSFGFKLIPVQYLKLLQVHAVHA